MASKPYFVTHTEQPSKWHPGYFAHLTKEGSRAHVLSWTNLKRQCSEPLCEINAPRA